MGRSDEVVLALLLTTASLVIAVVGVLLTECASSAISLFGNDPVQLCAGVAQFGIDPQPWMGVGLIVIAILGVIAAWMPTKRRRAKRADVRSISALQDNLSRVRQITPTSMATPARRTETSNEQQPEPGPLDALSQLVDDLRSGFESEGATNQDLMETWVATMRICNDLHNAGELTTADFKMLNTGLLELVTPDLARAAQPSSS